MEKDGQDGNTLHRCLLKISVDSRYTKYGEYFRLANNEAFVEGLVLQCLIISTDNARAESKYINGIFDVKASVDLESLYGRISCFDVSPLHSIKVHSASSVGPTLQEPAESGRVALGDRRLHEHEKETLQRSSRLALLLLCLNKRSSSVKNTAPWGIFQKGRQPPSFPSFPDFLLLYSHFLFDSCRGCWGTGRE
ncbi:hypothetical protein XELAEV_18014427mg [Xenopus laevis]|uniref:Uncharacterized protein n=1 Tax=Xenopus laevis TaxID=8355 RepID=A0A974DH79_XENLA|nr:hypothetical protein XELAEV_18014427mg [Xenopus laevis]